MGTSTLNTSADVHDGSTTMVCTGSELDCGCLSWSRDHKVCEIPADGGPPRSPQAERSDVWSFVPVAVTSADSITADISQLNLTGTDVYAIKFGWSFSGA